MTDPVDDFWALCARLLRILGHALLLLLHVHPHDRRRQAASPRAPASRRAPWE